MTVEDRHAPASRPRVRPAAARLLLRGILGFAAGLAVWTGFSDFYDRALAASAETVIRLAERPAVTHLVPGHGEIVVERSDFPPAAPRPGLPAGDIHFNFVILAALFAAVPPLRPGKILLGVVILFAVHVVALCAEVESLYATRLGEWSGAHYGAVARNMWAATFHVYQIAGRFAAPFAVWWPLGGWDLEQRSNTRGPARKKRRGGRS
jgi:hypothetical protein